MVFYLLTMGLSSDFLSIFDVLLESTLGAHSTIVVTISLRENRKAVGTNFNQQFATGVVVSINP